jgi:hypothetical protein
MLKYWFTDITFDNASKEVSGINYLPKPTERHYPLNIHIFISTKPFQNASTEFAPAWMMHRESPEIFNNLLCPEGKAITRNKLIQYKSHFAQALRKLS